MRAPVLPPAVPLRRRLLAAGGGAAVLSACGTPKMLGTYELTEVPAPAWRNGQSWTWRRTDVYTRLAAGVITRRVLGREALGLRMVDELEGVRPVDDGRPFDTLRPFQRVFGDMVWGEGGLLLAGTLSDFGPVTGRFDPPLPVYPFPLQSGKNWRWTGRRIDSNDFPTLMTLAGRVDGWETLDVLGKPTRVIILVRDWNFGPPDPFRGNLFRRETEWYAPELGGAVRLHSEEYYYERRNVLSTTPGYRYDWVLARTT